MPHFVILWEARVFFCFFNFVKNAQFCHFVRGPRIFFASSILSKCSILSFWERTVNLFTSSILSKMLNFVIFWEGRVFFSHFNIVKNGPFCHFWKVDFKLWDKHKYTMSTHSVMWYSKLFLSKMPHFVILRRLVYFSLLQVCQKWSILSFSERGKCIFFLHFFNFVKNCPFSHFWKVDFKLWDKHKYTMCTLCVVIYQTNFVKNAAFCHFVRGSCIFSLLQFCQKCSILSFCERPVDFFPSSFLSKMLNFVILWETRVFFRFFNFVKNAQFCHFLRGPWIFRFFNFVKMLNFVIFWEASAFFSIFQFLSKWSILSFLKRGLQIMR